MTVIVQFPPAEMVAPQVLVAAKSVATEGGVAVIGPIVTGIAALVLFVMVTAQGERPPQEVSVLLRGSFPKARVVEEKATVGSSVSSATKPAVRAEASNLVRVV